MNSYTRTTARFQPASKLPLTDVRLRTLYWPETTAGQHVHRRYGVRPKLADLVAEFAGLGRIS
jgi:hypothetical protein